jgi:cell division protein FtsI (penicillin-binding protein 3)
MSPEIDPDVRVARGRLRIVAAVFALGMVALGARMVDLALPTGHPAVAAVTAPVVVQRHRRADILDRNGVLLATDYPKASVFADPAEVIDPAASARQLARALHGLDEATLRAKLSADGRFVWLKRHITDAEQREIIRLGLPGIRFRTELHRVYPQRALTAHIVGYVGVENQGLAGIERSFEERLTGDVSQGPLVLTLDLGVQEVVRSELAAAVTRFKAKGGTGLVLDVATGEIVGMVSLPDFDPNRYQRATVEQRFNRNSQGSYELGSLFKLFTVAMALDAGVVDMTDGFDASRPFEMRPHRIHDFHAHQRWLSVPEIVAFSSNIGAARMADALGGEGQRAYFGRFGLLDRHSIRLPEVGRPMVPSRWRPINTVTAAYGHGIAVSPLQVVDAVAGAICAQPPPAAHLVTEIVPTERAAPLVSADTTAKLRWLMWLTVAEGTGTQAGVPGYLVGGKTGSADKVGRGGYRGGGVMASFVAAFPIDRPRYVVLVTIDEPKGDAATYYQGTGGWTAAPTVGRIISRIGPLVGLPPVEPGAERWFRERLIQGQALNGRTHRSERSFAAAPFASWRVNGGERACACGPCWVTG